MPFTSTAADMALTRNPATGKRLNPATGKMVRGPVDPYKRFEDKYIPEPNSGCWLWVGAYGQGGYGRFKLGKVIEAHRAAFLLYVGAIPTGALVCHRCDNRACVNPDHLWMGSQVDNMADAVRKGRMPKGDASCASRVTDAEVREIRALAKGGVYQNQLAARYGLSKAQVSRIVNGSRRRHAVL